MIEVHVPYELLEGFPLFIQRRMSDLETLKAAFKKKDSSCIYEIAHKMKGNGAVYGFDIISKIGQDLMSLNAENPNWPKISTNIKKLESALKDYKVV
jgi:HPt (histidine-containing phosphotransfer) domain-containing protein